MSLRAYIAGLVLAVAVHSANAAPIAYAEGIAASAFGNQSTLYSIDLATRVATPVGPSVPNSGGLVNSLNPFNMRGLSFDPAGQLFAVAEDLGVLVKINKTNGTATLVGPLNLSGPGVANAQFLELSMAITCDGKAWLASGTTGNFWSVNLSTGATALVGSLGASAITGLTARANTVYATGSQSNQKLYTVNTANGVASLVGAYGGSDGAVPEISPAFDASGLMWALLANPVPNTISNNIATIAANGALSKIGTVTGPVASGVGLDGLAIAPAVCAAPVDPFPIIPAPMLSLRNLIVLLLALAASAAWSLHREFGARDSATRL